MIWETPRRDNICAAIISYYPDRGFPDRVARIAHQVRDVVIVDNHSPAPTVCLLRDLSSQLAAHLILNPDNLGIAAALNQAFRWALNRGYRWMMTLDQDSIVAPHLVDTLARVGNQFQKQDRVVIIGSAHSEMTSKTPNVIRTEGLPWREEHAVITSGSLVSLTAFETIGPFREEFFIDLVDTEYCLRARSMGYRVIASLTSTMRHSIGATSRHKILWANTGTSNHPAFRRYYMVRNHVILAQEYILKEPTFVIRTLYSKIKSLILMLLFERKRFVKLRYAALGLWDGLIHNVDRKVKQAN